MIDLSGLNEAQKQSVTHTNGPLLIVAGAGTGKTTVITNRVAWLIDQKLAKPDEILCLTFTEKAASEMEERIDRLLPYGYVDVWVMTFHAFAERLLRDHAVEIGLPSDFKLLDETGQWMLAYKHFERFPLKEYKPFGSPARFIPDMLRHFSRLKDEGIRPQQYADHVESLALDKDNAAYSEAGRVKELADCYAAYQQLLTEQHCVDFGDLILYLGDLFEKRPALLQRYREQFKYILVDEFQDTNWSQYAFLKMLAEPINNITVVGDDDQSVYKFRGASLSNILSFHKDFPGCRQIVLTENYRSCQNILDLAYAFIQNNNPNRLEYQLQQATKPKKGKKGGLASVSKKLVSKKGGPGIIEHLHAYDAQEEARAVIDKMIALRQEDSARQWKDFAVLVRANSQADLFLQQMTLAGIPYQFLASEGLFSKPVVLDVISFLKAIDRYTESRALYRLLILPTIDMANDDLMKLLHHADEHGLSLHACLKQAAAVGLSEQAKSQCDLIVSRLEQHASFARTHDVTEVAMKFIDDYGLKHHYETLDPVTQQDTYNLLNQFWRIMRQFESEEDDRSVGAFLQYLDLAKSAGDAGSLPVDVEIGPDTVKVMTIHGSKGLEFPYVFIVNMVDRRFPSANRKDALPIPDAFVKEQRAEGDFHLEEERRLCYVAITRAKQGVYFTSAQDYGGARQKKPSRFLSELGFAHQEAQKRVASLPLWSQGAGRSHEVVKAKTVNYASFLPKSFSYTQLSTFERCPWQYRYAHILKIPKRGSHVQSFGQTLHRALEKFFKAAMERKMAAQTSLFARPRPADAGVPPSLEELLAMYESSWLDSWYRDEREKEEYRARGRDILREFYRVHAGQWPEVMAAEKRFHIKMGEFSLNGSIDRIDRGANGLHLIDYKSRKAPKSDRSIKKDQLILYQIAVEEALQEPVETLTFYYLTDNQARSFSATDKQKDALRSKVVNLLDSLANSDFEPTPSREICRTCPYADICQFRMV